MKNTKEKMTFIIEYKWIRNSKYKGSGYDEFVLVSENFNFHQMLKQFKENLKGWHGSGFIKIYGIRNGNRYEYKQNHIIFTKPTKKQLFLKKWSEKLEKKNLILKFKNSYEPSRFEILSNLLESELSSDKFKNTLKKALI